MGAHGIEPCASFLSGKRSASELRTRESLKFTTKWPQLQFNPTLLTPTSLLYIIALPFEELRLMQKSIFLNKAKNSPISG